MKNTMRKLLAVLLVLVLALSMTTAAFAEGDTADDADPDVTAGTSETAEPGETEPAEETEGTEEPEEPEEPSDPDSAVPVEAEPGTEPAAAPEEDTDEAPVDEDPADETVYVAKIGDDTYETLQSAFSAANAAGSAIIELQKDVTIVNGQLTASGSSIIVNGNDHSINISYDETKTSGGNLISVTSGNLTFKDCSITLVDNGSSYNGTITLNNTSSLTFDDVDISLDGANASGERHGIYLWENGNPNLVLNVINGSSLTIKNYPQDALEWNGNPTDYFNIVDSIVDFTENRSGIAGTFNITVTNSTLNVTNNRGNGSNGAHYTITNSVVNYIGNRSHGLSAGNVIITDSLVTCKDNAYTGFHVAGTFDASTTGTGKYMTKIDVSGNSWSTWGNDLFAGLRLIGNATVGDGVTMNISDNYGVGIRASEASASYTFAEGTSLTVMNNGKPISNGTQYNTKGGGIWNKGTMILPSSAVIYNNHATLAGDDIYNEGSITLGPVGSGWALDGTEGTNDCLKTIDGWYEDGAAGEDSTEGSRWTAHDENYHVVPVAAGTIPGTAALKAAHGIPTETVPVDIVLYKLDSVTEKPIPGVEFSVYSDSACKNLIATLTTGTDGSFCLEDVQDGTCYLKETKAAPGYKAVADVFTLTVKTVDKVTETALEDGEAVTVVSPIVSYELKCDTPCIAELEDDNIAIVNDAVVDITIQKVWVDNNNAQGRSKSVEISLRANGKEIEKVVLSDENKWAASYTLPKYDEEGKEIKYSIVELTKVDGYVTGYSTDGFTVYNTLSSLAPKTGDESRLGLWLGLMGLSAACAGAALILGKKRKANG